MGWSWPRKRPAAARARNSPVASLWPRCGWPPGRRPHIPGPKANEWGAIQVPLDPADRVTHFSWLLSGRLGLWLLWGQWRGVGEPRRRWRGRSRAVRLRADWDPHRGRDTSGGLTAWLRGRLTPQTPGAVEAGVCVRAGRTVCGQIELHGGSCVVRPRKTAELGPFVQRSGHTLCEPSVAWPRAGRGEAAWQGVGSSSSSEGSSEPCPHLTRARSGEKPATQVPALDRT